MRVVGTIGAGVGLGEHLRADAFGEVLRVLERTSASTASPRVTYRGSAVVSGLALSAQF